MSNSNYCLLGYVAAIWTGNMTELNHKLCTELCRFYFWGWMCVPRNQYLSDHKERVEVMAILLNLSLMWNLIHLLKESWSNFEAKQYIKSWTELKPEIQGSVYCCHIWWLGMDMDCKIAVWGLASELDGPQTEHANPSQTSSPNWGGSAAATTAASARSDVNALLLGNSWCCHQCMCVARKWCRYVGVTLTSLPGSAPRAVPMKKKKIWI